MKYPLILSCTVALVFLIQTAGAEPNAKTEVKSFAQWCKEKESVPAARRRMIDALLKEAGTNDCQVADSKLRGLTQLKIAAQPISDIKPLAGLINLTELRLNESLNCPIKCQAYSLSRQIIVGWSMVEHMRTDLILTALEAALGKRTPSAAGLLFHSDRGSQYASSDYQFALQNAGITCSMSRRANCWDNAIAESFFWYSEN